MEFQELNLNKAILKAIQEVGYHTPTPIQQKAIPIVLKGHDLLGCAQTGTGKTAAFAIPMLQRMGRPVRGQDRPVRGLILTPTRELALQIYENLCQYSRYIGRVAAVVFGGVSQNPQVEAIRNGADILVATPGRLWDLIEQELLDIGKVECFVLDEADRMLDMGFLQDVKRIIACLPRKRQTLLFSATMPKEIKDLAKTLLHSPKYVSITPAATPVECIAQGVYFVEKQAKRDLLKMILEERNLPQTLVFTRTKHGADRVARDLTRAGITAKVIHGDKSQNARQNALKQFKDYKVPVLVATDIAARGIDISELPLVVNYDLPNVPETYVHRIGRTGRAGQEGTAISFCDPSELSYLKEIEDLTQVVIGAIEPPSEIPQAEAHKAARYVKSEKRVAQKTRNQSSAHKEKHAKTAKTTERKKNLAPNHKKEQTNRATRKQRAHREEVETRVDVMTPHTGRPLSPSTAARIRAKVEAKLAERRAVQAKRASVQSHSVKQGKIARKSQTRRGRARG